jgi:ABC-2 type transport system ATP-binding protein
LLYTLPTDENFDMEDTVIIKGLTKTYKGKRRAVVHALSDLSLSVAPGEIFGFLGPNGAGKSTTIKSLVGLITPSAGSAFLCGRAITDPLCRSSIGYLPENPTFYDFLTAREYLAFVGRSFAMDAATIRSESDRVLKLLELTNAANRPIRGYSKGMVQRLGLAQTLLHDPELYILDEPMSGLDPIGRALVKEIMKDLKGRGKTVFFSTHITADVEAVCDRVGIIVNGRLQTINRVEDILEEGIEGYYVQLTNCNHALVDGFAVTDRGDQGLEAYVPRERFMALMERVAAGGASVTLIEPKRKDLEAFFLDIVQKGRV